MEIQKIVSDAGIRPADIEKMTGGEIRLPQASVMIKKALAGGAGLSATTRWFLCLASQAHSISQSIISAGNSELLEGKSLIERAAPAVESITESWMRLKEAVKKLPPTPPKDTKKSVTKLKKNEEIHKEATMLLSIEGGSTGDNMVRKRRNGYWALFLSHGWCRLPFGRVDERFMIVGMDGTFSLFDFTEV